MEFENEEDKLMHKLINDPRTSSLFNCTSQNILNKKLTMEVDDNDDELMYNLINDPHTSSLFNAPLKLHQNNLDKTMVIENDDELMYRLINDPLTSHRFNNNSNKNMQGGALKLYQKVKEYETIESTLYGLKEKVIEFKATNVKINNFIEANQLCNEFIEEICNDYIKKLPRKTKVKLIIEHDSFTYPMRFPFIFKEQLTPDIIWDRFETIIQSRKKDPNYENNKESKIVVILKIAETITGSARLKKGMEPSQTTGAKIKRSKRAELKIQNINLNKIVPLRVANSINIDEYIKTKNCIVNSFNKDNYCLLRAVLLGIAFLEEPKSAGLYLTKKKSEFEEKVLKTSNLIKLEDTPAGYKEYIVLENYFKHYQIMIIDKNYVSKVNCIYLNEDIKFEKFIYVLHHQHHYYLIKSMKSYTNRSYYCHYCKIGYNTKSAHHCNDMCKACCRTNIVCLPSKPTYSCTYQNDTYKCMIKGRNEECIKLHLAHICQKHERCKLCNMILTKTHVCLNQKWCKNCKKAVGLEHKCFILTEKEKEQVHKKKEKPAPSAHIFFDFEAYVDEKTNKHIVNFAAAQLICPNCVNYLDEEKRCNECKQRHEFENIEQFTDWLLNKNNAIVIAHNFKAYDGILLMKHILESRIPCDEKKTLRIISNGNKIISLLFRTLKFVDSYSFIASSLASFSKTFNIKTVKGFFPHLFNSILNQNYVGTYPDAFFYQPDLMHASKRLEFYAWYNEIKKKEIFDFKYEMRKYCWADVRLLTEGCIHFRHVMMENSININIVNDQGIDPFANSFTIASYCNLIFRRNFMDEGKIGIIPENGYNPKQNVSKKSIIWLKYLANKDKIQIKNNTNGGEKKVGNFFLDGFCAEKKTIYEFNGCFWHGCLQCYTSNTWNPVKQCTMKTINKNHKERVNFIQSQLPSFNIVSIWEHEWDHLIKTDEKCKLFVDTLDDQQELKIRNCLYGGRTNAIILHKKCKSDEYISYIDVTSLYPYVQKYKKFPVGHPIIITDNFSTELKKYKKFFGLIKCSINPPKALYLGVLPVRINNKLCFPLCYKCANDLNKEVCNHTIKERKFTGSWCTVEIDLAIEHGYTIDKIYEVWHFESSEQYDPITKQGGLFTKYMNMALKEKQESSGYPDDVTTDEQKHAYIEAFFLKEGIILDPLKIEKNSGRRASSKIIANSQWGLLAMALNKVQHTVINDRKTWIKMSQDDQYIIENVEIFDSTSPLLQVYYTYNDNFFPGDNKTNVVLASFVTSYARIHLYNELFKLDKRVLYFDTDSIIFISNKNDKYIPKLGNYLGDWTSEISAEEGYYIDEFVSAGPKNYAYKTKNGQTDCTIKGFTLNYITSLSITFDSIKDIVCNNRDTKIIAKQLEFKASKKDYSISTSVKDKKYGFVYDKRVLFEDLTTLPYGY